MSRSISHFTSNDLVNKSILRDALDKLYKSMEQLRPNTTLHDHQLTYPPAAQIETPKYAYQPTGREFTNLAIGKHRNAALYFHFGFCRYKCRFCHHYEINPNSNEDIIHDYIVAMMREMNAFKHSAPSINKLIYFLGGSTTTAVPPATLDMFLNHLHKQFGAPASKLSTVEVKPSTVTKENLSLLTAAGFKRINLGAQSLDADLYAIHHHGEDVHTVYNAIELARSCGFEYINLDIFTGLEGQSEKSWQITLKKLTELITTQSIDSVFIHPYQLDPDSKSVLDRNKLPSPLEVMHSEAIARQLFEQLGWRESGSRFYRSPRHVLCELLDVSKSRANPSYGEMLYHGFGNASFSVGDRAGYLNYRDLNEYIRQVSDNKLPISHWLKINPQQQAVRDVTFDLMYNPYVRYRSIYKKYGKESMGGIKRTLAGWSKLGLGSWNHLLGTWHLSPLGRLVHRQMIPTLFAQQDRVYFDERMLERY